MTKRQSENGRTRKKLPDADRLVRILPSNLRAAMSDGHWTSSKLAQRMAVLRPGTASQHRQTIHAMAQGESSKRCRRSRRDLLAEALDVPAAWLGGEPIALPFTSSQAIDDLSRRSPRVGLAALRLARQCAKACARDLHVTRKEAAELLIPSDPRHEVVNALTWALARLADVAQWRRQLLSPLGVQVPLAAEEHGMTPPWQAPVTRWSERQEEAGLGMVHALALVFDPWLKGEAVLNYERLGNLVALVAPIFHVLLPEADRPNVPFVERDGHRVVRDALSPFALLRWLPQDRAASIAAKP